CCHCTGTPSPASVAHYYPPCRIKVVRHWLMNGPGWRLQSDVDLVQHFQMRQIAGLTSGLEVALHCLMIPSTPPAPFPFLDPADLLILGQLSEGCALVEVVLDAVAERAVLLRLLCLPWWGLCRLGWLNCLNRGVTPKQDSG